MARPQKFRLTTDEVLEPQHARKLAGHVSEIEFFRKEIEKLQQQVADIYDAADEDGFDKKFVRKAVAKRAKDSSVLAAEEHGLEAYEMAIEKGMATRARERNPKSAVADDEEFDAETGEITEPQPTKAAGQVDQPAPVAISSERVAATSSVENEAAEISTPIQPEPVGALSEVALPTTDEDTGLSGQGSASGTRSAGSDGSSPSQAPVTETGKPVEASASAAPLSFAEKIKRLRPNCQHPQACRSSGGKVHCGPCGRVAETGSAA